MTKTAKSKTPTIFPIYLSEGWAHRLIKQHAWAEFEEGARFKYNAVFSYSAAVRENGEVDLLVSYSDDNGFCMSSGTCMRKTVTPFSPKELANIKTKRMFEIAEAEYTRRELEKHRKAVLKVQAELFEV